MKKLLNFCLIASIIACSPALQAENHESMQSQRTPLEDAGDLPSRESEAPAREAQEPSGADENEPLDRSHSNQDDSTQDPTTPSDESATPETTPSDYENEGTPVGQAASEGSKAAKRKQWQNIALATAAVAVTVTALILIANNDGHRSKD
jgi:hypothetical protein